MLFRIKGGADPQDAGSLDFFFPFMIFGVSGVALSKKKGGAEREFMNRHRGTGIVLASAALIVATTVGFILLAMPVLNMAADTGYGIIRAIARPCGNLLIAILRFIFRRPSADSGAGEGGSDDLGPVMDTTGGEGFFQIIVRYCVIGLTIAAGVFLVLFLGWLLVRWLLSRTRRDDRERNGRGTAGLFSLLKRFACMIRELILRVCTVFTGGNRGIVDIYLAFLRWGRRGGLPRGISETPREYGVRLSVAYPFAAGEIDRITEVFNQYYFGRAQLRRAEADELKDGNQPPGPVPAAATAGAAPDGASGADPGSYMFGELTAGGEERARAASISAAALRRLRNPAFFLPRLKVWISR